MHAVVCDRGQMVIPAKVRRALQLQKGDVLAVSLEGNIIKLERIDRPAPEKPDRIRFIKKNGFTVGVTKRTITTEQVKALLAEFP